MHDRAYKNIVSIVIAVIGSLSSNDGYLDFSVPSLRIRYDRTIRWAV